MLPLPDEVFYLFDELIKLSPTHPCGITLLCGALESSFR
jgi:hypothetical protein